MSNVTGAFTNKESSKTGIILIIVIVVIILILSFVFGGVDGFLGIIKFFITFSLIVGFIGLLIYVVYYLFFRVNRRDIPFENWKSYRASALENGSDMMEELVLTGDQMHSAKRFFTIKGYLRIKGFDGKEYDLFVGKRNPANFLEEYKIVMLNPT